MGLVKSIGDLGQARDRGRRFVAYGHGVVTSIADIFLLAKLPDDVKQNIEDAGARYIPYVPRLL